MKRTYQPKKRKRARDHGFRARMQTKAGRVSQAPPRQGPQAPDRLTAVAVEDVPSRSAGPKRTKRGRLSRSAEFERVYRQGRSHGGPALRAARVPARPRGLARRGAAPRRCPCRARSGARSTATRSSACCARRSRAEAARLPGDVDVVVVARPDALELAEREGLDGVQAALARARRHAPAGSGHDVRAPDRGRADRRLPPCDLAVLPRRCKYEPTLLGLRGPGRFASSAYCAGWCSPPGACCAATRSATAASTRSTRSGSSPHGRPAAH